MNNQDVPMLWLCLRTKNDINGNPRRVWLGYDIASQTDRLVPCHVVPARVVNEGYGNVKTKAGDIVLCNVEVPPSEYNRWLRYAKDNKILEHGL